jgi:cysteinyl-tRNA synthetase
VEASIDFSDEELSMAKTAIERIENTLMRAEEFLKVKNSDTCEDTSEFEKVFENSKNKFHEGMDDDFNTAIALGGIFELVKEINRFIDLGKKSEKSIELFGQAVDFIKQVIVEVLGVELVLKENISHLTLELKELLGEETEGDAESILEKILEKRLNAKVSKNYALSDEIRNKLIALGIEIKDGKDKTSWTLKK